MQDGQFQIGDPKKKIPTPQDVLGGKQIPTPDEVLGGKKKEQEPFRLLYKRSKIGSMDALLSGSHPLSLEKNALTENKVTPKQQQDASVRAITTDYVPNDEELTKEAIERIPEHGKPVTDDPIGEIVGNIAKSKEVLNDQTKGRNISPSEAKEYAVKNKQVDIITNHTFQSGEGAKKYILNNISVTPVLNDIDNATTDELMKLAGNNLTKQLAVKRYDNYRKVEDAFKGNKTLEEAALEYAAKNGDEQVSYLMEKGFGRTDAVPPSMRGEKVMQFIMNPDLRELAEKHPALKTELKEAIFNFPSDHPEYAVKILATLIANKREEEGGNNLFANVVGKQNTDRIVNELIENGLPANYKFVYEKLMRPKLGTWPSIGRGIGNAIPGFNQLVNESPIPTPGLLENIESGAENVETGIAKSISHIIGLTGAIQPRSQQVYNALEKQYSTPDFEPSGLLHKATMPGGQMIPFVVSLVGGSGALKALNLIKNSATASGTMMVLATHGDNMEKAKTMFPRNDLKQGVYVGVMNGLNAVMGKYLPGQKLFKGESPVAEAIKSMVDGNITTTAAKNTILNWLGNTAKGTLNGAEFTGAIAAADDILSQTLQGKGIDFSQSLERGWEGAKVGALSTVFLAGAESALKSNKGLRDEYYNMASHPDIYKQYIRQEAEKDPEFAKVHEDVLKNLDYISGVKKDLDENYSGYTEDQKKQFVINSLAAKVKTQKAESATDPTVKKKFQQEAKNIEEIKEGTLRGIPEEKIKENQAIKEVKELYNEGFLGKGSMELLESKKTEEAEPKFDENKVKSYLKYIAEQSNNINEKGEFDTSTDVRKSVKKQYPSQLIELANEMFPEYSKIAEEHEALNKSNISVIQPGEIPPHEIITIAPKQIPSEPKSKGSGEKEPPISEPPTGSKIHVERPAIELSHRGLQNVANEFSLPDVQSRDTKSDLQLKKDAEVTVNDWAEKGEYGKNVEGLVKKAEGGDILTDKERLILEQHLANVSSELRSMDKNSPEFDVKLSEIKRLKEAGQKTRSEAGAALRIPLGGSRPHPIADLGDALVGKMEANGVETLTEAQKSEVERQVKLYEEKTKVAEDKVREMETKMAELEAGKNLSETVKKSKLSTGKNKSAEDFKAERKQIIDELKAAKQEHEDYLKQQGIQKMGGGITLTPKMIKVIGKLVKSHADEIGENLKDVTAKVFEQIKDFFDGITEKDVHDIIAGVYNQKRETRSELSLILNNLNTEAKLINKLENLLNGVEPKSENGKIQRNQRIKDLRKQIDDFRKEQRQPGIDPDVKKMDSIRKQNEEKAKTIRERIKNGDFEAKPKPSSIFDNPELEKKYPKQYRSMLDAVKEREDAKHAYDISLLEDQYKKQNVLQKSGRYVKMAIATTKALKSGIDDSGVFVQNIVAMIAHPRSGAKAFITHIDHFFSQKRFDQWLTKLHNNKPVWDLIQKSGLEVTEPASLNQAKREEAFSHNALDKSFKIGGKEYNIGKYTTKPFERLFTTIGNAMRVNMFLRIANRWAEEGRTFETNPEDYKSLATLLNTETARGKLHKNIEKASELITAGIWSPRLMASRLNILGLSDLSSPVTGKGFYQGLSPRIRKMAAADVGKFIGTGVALMGAAAAMGGKADFDPESPTFGTVKIGNYTVSVFDGFNKYVKTIVQFSTGKKHKNGQVEDAKRGETFWRFWRGSTTPATGVAIDLTTGKDYMGKPVTPVNELKNLAVPMSIPGIVDPIEKDGMIGILPGLGSFFGINISDEREFSNSGKSNNRQTRPSRSHAQRQRAHEQRQ